MKTNDDIKVLDHGYIRYIEHWGSDERIIESARMSTNKGFQGWGDHRWCECGHLIADHSGSGRCLGRQDDGGCLCNLPNPRRGDEKLLRYLYEHAHHTPFEMAGMTIEVQAPIFVFREWHRHRTQSYNEMSARYTVMPNLHYVPSVDRIMQGGQGQSNKQGSEQSSISINDAEYVRKWIADKQDQLYQQYITLLDHFKLSRELARINTPVSRYSRMRASANLRNWLAFLTLRMDEHAQWEIRQYANVVGELIATHFPRTWELFVEGRLSHGQS